MQRNKAFFSIDDEFNVGSNNINMNLDEVKNYTFIKLIRLIKLACATVFTINKRKK